VDFSRLSDPALLVMVSLMHLALLIAAPAAAMASSIVRHVQVNSRAQRSHASASAWSSKMVAGSGKSEHKGLAFWHALRKDLEAKRHAARADTGNRNFDSELSSEAVRDLLWKATHEVDEETGRKYECTLKYGIAFAKNVLLVQGQTDYIKKGVETARECALMCAADSVGKQDKRLRDLSCQSFTYNKTAKACRFFNFAQQPSETMNQFPDTCCASGPPCNLGSMRKEIQTYFLAELKQKTQERLRAAKSMMRTKQPSEDMQVASQATHATSEKDEQKGNVAMRASFEISKAGEVKPATFEKDEQDTNVVARATLDMSEETASDPLSDHISPGAPVQVQQPVSHVKHWSMLALLIGAAAFSFAYTYSGFLCREAESMVSKISTNCQDIFSKFPSYRREVGQNCVEKSANDKFVNAR
jgi:hypothetical protein